MNTPKLNKAVVIVWMALALSLGSGVVGAQFGLDFMGTAHACGLSTGGGGGCQ